MRITYLGHSGFLAETKEHYLLFDYYITYVLSGDIRRKRIEELVHRENELLSVKAHETYRLYGDQMAIETLRSTDIGVAYLVTLLEEGRTYCFYHAGDLNLWKWAEESKAHNNNMEANFRREMELIRGRHFDAAFVPLDPRQEDFAFGGMDLFLETADADAVFPMHFWKQPEIIRAYLKARPQVKNLILLEEEGRTCEF